MLSFEDDRRNKTCWPEKWTESLFFSHLSMMFVGASLKEDRISPFQLSKHLRYYYFGSVYILNSHYELMEVKSFK